MYFCLHFSPLATGYILQATIFDVNYFKRLLYKYFVKV